MLMNVIFGIYRFTLDDWHTTSEVKASYRESLGSLPEKWRSWVLGGECLFLSLLRFSSFRSVVCGSGFRSQQDALVLLVEFGAFPFPLFFFLFF